MGFKIRSADSTDWIGRPCEMLFFGRSEMDGVLSRGLEWVSRGIELPACFGFREYNRDCAVVFNPIYLVLKFPNGTQCRYTITLQSPTSSTLRNLH